MSAQDQRKKLIFIGLAIAVVLVVLYFFISGWSEWSRLQSDLEARQDELAQLEGEKQMLELSLTEQNVPVEWDATEATLGRIPPLQERFRVRQDLNQLAGSYGLTGFALTANEPIDLEAADSASVGVLEAAAGELMAVPFELTFTSSYAESGNFLYQLSQLRSLSFLDSVRMRREEQSIRTEIELRVLFRKEASRFE